LKQWLGLTDDAQDLRTISSYTLQVWGAEQESRYLKGLWRKLSEIHRDPDLYRVRKDLVIGCRSARYERHVIFFVVAESEIQVIRILHGAMDFRSQLADELD
jgi:toxin ParE1/3/4